MIVEKIVCYSSFWLFWWIIFSLFFHSYHCDFYSTCCSNDNNNTRSTASRISTTKYNDTGLSSATTTARVIDFIAVFFFVFFSIGDLIFSFVYVTKREWSTVTQYDSFKYIQFDWYGDLINISGMRLNHIQIKRCHRIQCPNHSLTYNKVN